MNTLVYRQSRLRNMFHTAMYLVAMTSLLGFLGWVLMGPMGLLIVGGSGLIILAFSPKLSAHWIMRWARARPLLPYEMPGLHQLSEQLALRAGLERAPTLFVLPSHEINAFAVGSSKRYAIALSTGLLRNLNQRELVGVLAHELSHITQGDLRVMALAGVMGRLTRSLSTFGIILILLYLPIAFSQGSLPVLLFLTLLAVPYFNGLLQLALSRTREFAADANAAALTGDPRGLASALNTLDRVNGNSLWQHLFSPLRNQEAHWLRTHPGTEERIKRLLALDLPDAKASRWGQHDHFGNGVSGLNFVLQREMLWGAEPNRPRRNFSMPMTR